MQFNADATANATLSFSLARSDDERETRDEGRGTIPVVRLRLTPSTRSNDACNFISFHPVHYPPGKGAMGFCAGHWLACL